MWSGTRWSTELHRRRTADRQHDDHSGAKDHLLRDGEPIGQVFLHGVFHVTFRDANGNGEPDPGEITANVDRFLFTCR